MNAHGFVDEYVEVRLHPDALTDEPRVVHLAPREVRPELRVEEMGLTAVYVLTARDGNVVEYLFDHIE